VIGFDGRTRDDFYYCVFNSSQPKLSEISRLREHPPFVTIQKRIDVIMLPYGQREVFVASGQPLKD
jgi:hypothetical protein